VSSVPHIAVVGAGQLGSRHLQALARLDRPAVVHVIDPFAASLQRAKERFDEVANVGTNVELALSEAMTSLPAKLDAVIVATNADHRAEVVRHLLSRARVRYLVLEKVLFPREDEYGEIGERLAAAKTPAWVNCPRRMSKGYQSLKSQLQGPVEYRLEGSGWGLACNSIHFLDHAAFLIGREDLRLTEVDLQPGVISSKRAGYVEFLGRLRGEFGDGSTVELNCPAEAATPIAIDLTTASQRIRIREDRSEMQFRSGTGAEWMEPLPAVYQSQLSQLVVQELLDRATCPLTPYAESCRLHRPFLAALLDHYRRHVDPGAVACPIT
jgi:predicted dehydrogenase